MKDGIVGVVVDIEPNHLYRVRLPSGTLVRAHIGPGLQMRIVRVSPGDRVRVELSQLDTGRGRIVGVMANGTEQRS